MQLSSRETSDYIQSPSTHKGQFGFTISELMIALALMGMVASLVLTMIISMQKYSTDQWRKHEKTSTMTRIYSLVSKDLIRCRQVEELGKGRFQIITSEGKQVTYQNLGSSLHRNQLELRAYPMESVELMVSDESKLVLTFEETGAITQLSLPSTTLIHAGVQNNEP